MILYAVAKFVAYVMWCALGLHVMTGKHGARDALTFGALRWFLGLAFGIMAAIALGSVAPESIATLYVGVYVPLRIVEWSIMVILIARKSPVRRSLASHPTAWLWLVGGVVVSFATDLASPEGMQGRFCVGRCLC